MKTNWKCKQKGVYYPVSQSFLCLAMSLSLKAASADFHAAGEKARRRRRPRELSEEQKQEIVEAFNLFDTDKDQAVDYHELKVRFLYLCLQC